MRILVLGNCQARPLSTLLTACGIDLEEIEPIILHLAHNEDRAAHEAALEGADLILAQATDPTFAVAHLTSAEIRAHYPFKTIVWPNIFYAGQQPWLRYVTHPELGRIQGPLDAYHDLRLLSGWYLKRHGTAPIPQVDPADVARRSLVTLKNREVVCDVIVSDIIVANERNRRLFFTFNHPTQWLLAQVALRIATLRGLPFDAALAAEREPLSAVIVPSIDTVPVTAMRGPSVTLAEGGTVTLERPNRFYDCEELEALTYACYDHQAELLAEFPRLRLTPGIEPWQAF